MKPPISGLLALTLALGGLTGCAPTEPDLPWCPRGEAASTHAPTAPPSRANACRARATQLEPVLSAPARPSLPVPRPGYHHLGATSAGRWSGVLGRIEVRDTGVRPGTMDFVAARFMAKSGDGPDGVAWLEAGWSETGWSGDGRQRVYTYDTNTSAWSFYDQYAVLPGERLWVYLQTEGDAERPLWQAWLWWGDSWHLLAEQALPLTGRARIEQYVELHTDPAQPTALALPELSVDSVQLKDGPAGPLRPWQADIPTAPGTPADGYCLHWRHHYDTWTATTC
ncbi:hypothetical protein Cs7R123_79330 [Catellatospora sp. TT07R-123]|uniref:hypothetical protein n=1 Tax=Catellatospora sp. TT07R-123 TaxID=2733863 RepID=UPI001B234E5E|nr:hypothetical protein [Catellatospora sp. TT07R-123]GHJ50591.1 hypothetical protein Cs7R123_79330 [Catellatospora sp. TT07R-123]